MAGHLAGCLLTTNPGSLVSVLTLGIPGALFSCLITLCFLFTSPRLLFTAEQIPFAPTDALIICPILMSGPHGPICLFSDHVNSLRI